MTKFFNLRQDWSILVILVGMVALLFFSMELVDMGTTAYLNGGLSNGE